MEKVKIVTLTLFAALVVLVSRSECQLRGAPALTPRPLCASQFSLANYACARLPLRPVSPPAPPSPTSPDDEEEGRHHRQRGHKRRHRRHDTPEEDNCCRWATQVDSQCVCEMMYLLPSFANFLMRPVHQINLEISDACNVTYTCGGTILRA
jgi:hypothetical protein